MYSPEGSTSSARPASKLFASTEETCEITALGRTTVYQLLNEGVLRSVKVGRRRLVVIESIRALAAGSAGEA